MDKLSVAVIGCGYFGSMHAEIYATEPGVRLAVVADLERTRANALAGRLGCEGTDDWEAALSRADVDVVDVCVPDSLHTGVVLAALAQKKHVLIEKPLADTLENAKILLDACEGYPYKTMVGHICRFDIRYERAYEAIRDGTLGEIIYISSKRNSPTLGAKRYARQCKLITHSGVHDIDLVRWLTGREFENVYAASRAVRMCNEGFPGALDSIQAVFKLQGGITYSLENTWALPDKYPSYIDASMQIVGTRSAITMDFGDQGYRVCSNEGCEYQDVSYWTESFGVRKGDLRLELVHFLDCVRYDRTPRCSVRDGYEVAYAAIKVLESAERGEVVPVRGEG
ncbi:MAG: gfo/Idh/MocA family oxidoreductase [Clostridiales bacterium]|uniref:Gfo/Idh/MocA family protein n=1 Tax=Provencibacterium massiliense TaxID=1841868 RepID=UPI0009A62CD1|nr:Gfo/Idh/MocA family oxidoreductase [Provencibacterium massiliense]PWM35825.1 MAG: gfo/Idh/MocA family oxidoreductase [Clostridiales bacterium]RGB64132.1 gfo/Idh/MocA family oxidoreductase [Harryflintia acetispora]